MALCDPCKLDTHQLHRAHFETPIFRKGVQVGSSKHECSCEKCVTDGSWRGPAQPVPRGW